MPSKSATRHYEQTHPWITFHFDLSRLSHKTWLLLGEAQSKCQHVAGVPLKPGVSANLMRVYLSKGAHGTTSIEGNTLSEQQVLKRVEGDLPLPESQEYLGHEIDNIVRAYNDITDEVVLSPGAAPLCAPTLRARHKLLLDGQPLSEDVAPGEFRTHSVGVANYLGAPAEDCEYLVDRLCVWLEEGFNAPPGHAYLAFPLSVIRALLAHLYIAWIHPFGDGNGRVARLAEFQLLQAAGISLPACHVLSDHYNRTREAYYQVLARTSRVEGYPVEEFIQYAMQGFVDELREQIAVIRESQMEVTWENHVHSLFRDRDTPAPRRQKHIALDLPSGVTTPVSQVRRINVRIAEQYAGKTAKTVTRDLNALEKLNLIRRVKGGIRPNREIIEAFLPIKADPSTS